MLNNKYKIPFAFSLLLNILFVSGTCFFVAKKGGVSYLFQKTKSASSGKLFSNTYYSKTSQHDRLQISQGDIVFVGDSIIAGCQWNELLGSERIKNRGIDGDTLDGVLFRIKKLASAYPAKIFIMVGVNDIYNGKHPEQISEEYRTIIQTIRTVSPNTMIYVHSILPVNSLLYEGNISNYEVQSADKKLKAIVKREGAKYIDLYPLICDKHKELDRQYTFDGLHLNGNGYMVWKKAIMNEL